MVFAFIYMGMSVSWPLCMFCVFVCLSVCGCEEAWMISNQISISTMKKSHYVLDLSKVDTLLDKTHSKVLQILRYQGWTCVDP